MRRAQAVAVLAAGLTGTLACLRGPPWLVLVLALAAVAIATRRPAALATVLVPAALYAAILGALDPARASAGALAGARLGSAMALNLALVGRLGAERLLDGLRLPPAPTAWLAAVLLAATDVARDTRTLADARRLEGAWPRGARRLSAAAPLVPALAERAVRRAAVRAEALLVAGHATPAAFVPIVAIAALIVADRIALAPVPNIKLTYVAVFTGGLVFGWRAGAAAAMLGMGLTDFLFSGVYLPVYVNVAAMALLAFAGAALRPWRPSLRHPAWTVALALLGVACTLVFSVVSDALTVWLTPEGRDLAVLGTVVASGLAFNVPAAIVNGVLFATAVPAVAHRLDIRRPGA